METPAPTSKLLVRRLRASDRVSLEGLCKADTRWHRHFRYHDVWLNRALQDLTKPGRAAFGAFSPVEDPQMGESYRLDACVFFKPSDFDDSAELKSLLIRPGILCSAEYGGEGLLQTMARRVVEKAIRHCEVREIRSLEVELPQEEHSLISLFLQLGFRVTALRERYFPGQYFCLMERAVGDFYHGDPFDLPKLGKWLLRALLPCQVIHEANLNMDDGHSVVSLGFEGYPRHPAFRGDGRKAHAKRLTGCMILLEPDECTEGNVRQIIKNGLFGRVQLRYILGCDLSGVAQRRFDQGHVTWFDLDEVREIAGGPHSSLSLPLSQGQVGGVITVLEQERVRQYAAHLDGFVYYLLADYGWTLQGVEHPFLLVYCPSWQGGASGIVAISQIEEIIEDSFESAPTRYADLPKALSDDDLAFYRTHRDNNKLLLLRCQRLEIIEPSLEFGDDWWATRSALRDYLSRELGESNLVYVDGGTCEFVNSMKKIQPVVRDQIFISYAHADRKWLERLRRMLSPLVRNNTMSVWSDKDIKPGSLWREQISSALGRAKIAVLLVSDSFLASEFIITHELAPLLSAAKLEGITIAWVLISDCLYDQTKIAQYQALHDIGRPLDSLKKTECAQVIARACREIAALAK